ncbi:GroES-like protein [Trametes elegans]|nr:GroES-like protein [Trametes elegans]
MTLPTTQRSLVLNEESTPYVLAETPVPKLGPQDILIKILASALNPSDFHLVDPPFSHVFIKQFPHVSGMDGAGFVVQVGEEVKNRKEGDRVLFQGDYSHIGGGTFQQYAVAPSDLTAIIPENITFEQAATIPLALTTTVLLLYNQSSAPQNLSLRLKPVWEPEGTTAYAGTPALILGGSTSLGQFAIQLATLAGHNPIIATASLRNAPLLKSLGATHVLNRSLPPNALLSEVRAAKGGRRLEYAFAAVLAPDNLRLARDALAPGGALAVVVPSPTGVPPDGVDSGAPASSAVVPPDVADPGEGKRVGYVFGDAHLPHTRETSVALFKQIMPWLEQGVLKPCPVEVLPNGLAGINDGLARLKAGKVSGTKLVVRPQETP